MEPTAVIFKGSGAAQEFQNQPTEERKVSAALFVDVHKL